MRARAPPVGAGGGSAVQECLRLVCTRAPGRDRRGPGGRVSAGLGRSPVLSPRPPPPSPCGSRDQRAALVGKGNRTESRGRTESDRVAFRSLAGITLYLKILPQGGTASGPFLSLKHRARPPVLWSHRRSPGNGTLRSKGCDLPCGGRPGARGCVCVGGRVQRLAAPPHRGRASSEQAEGAGAGRKAPLCSREPPCTACLPSCARCN